MLNNLNIVGIELHQQKNKMADIYRIKSISEVHQMFV